MFSKISIIAIGKTTKELENIESHYLKQIKTNISFNILSPLSHLPVQEQIIKESASLLKHTAPGQFIIVLDSHGSELTSEEFARKLSQVSTSYKSISFIIGGSHGLSKEVKQSANLILSLSKLTLPHQLAKIILLEQLYRAGTIYAGSNYHK